MTTHIRSMQNERIKRAARLRDRRGRQQQQRIVVDGCREVRRALQSGLRAQEVFFCDTHLQDPQIQAIRSLIDTQAVETALVTPAVFEKIAYGNRSEGVVLIAAEPQRSLPELVLPDDALICVLEGVEKPGNVGAVLRTGAAAGLAAVVVADGGTDLYNHNTIRASLGAIFSMPVCAAPAAEVIGWLRRERFAIFAARVDGTVHYALADYRGKTALVLGSESHGLSTCWTGENVTAVSLPMSGVMDSLNVSATAAVLCYEAMRQRQV